MRKTSKKMRVAKPAPPAEVPRDEEVVGIDLGTTTSCVARVVGGAPAVVAIRGHMTTPSVVAVDAKGQRLVGHAAKRQAVTNPAGTLLAMKRLIGRKWESDEVKRTRMACPVTLVEGPQGDVRVELGGKVYSLPELSAMLLLDLKTGAEKEVGRPIKRAVITVPAYFNDNQRQATRDAGKIAGLDVLRIINEPTAAAIAYGYSRAVDKTVVVYDLGGGTFDISIVRVKPSGDFEVLGTGGDTFLGGEDFDRAVVDHLAREFKEAHGIDLRTERGPVQRLKEAAERAKIELSAQDATEIRLPFLHTSETGEAVGIERTLSRKELEAITADLVDRTLEHCRRALKAARVAMSQVDDVLLVGGSTRVPAVQEAVSRLFGKRPSQSVHPDEAVALGAAVHAAWLAGEAPRQIKLYDVTPHGLGIRVAGNRFRMIIPPNTRVPIASSMEATTTRDYQTQIRFVVLQGMSPKANENELLGEFTLRGLPERRAMTHPVDVELAIDEDGIVKVRATDRETGNEQALTVTASSGLTKQEVVEMTTAARSFAEERAAREEVQRASQAVEKAAADLSRTVEAAERRFKAGDPRRDAVEKAQDAVARAKDALAAGDPSELEDCATELVRRQASLKAMLGGR